MYFKKKFYVFIVLVAISLISVSAISASEINETNINTLGSHNDLSYMHDIGDLNYDEFHSSENLDNVTNTSDEQNSNLYNNISSVGKISDNDFLNDLSVVQNAESRNNKDVIDDIMQSNSLINSSDYTINQISENTFVLSFPDNSTMTLGLLYVSDLKTFKEAANSISTTKSNFDMLILDFKDNLNLNFDPSDNVLIKMDYVKKLFIRGYGARISINADKKDAYHFLSVNPDAAVWVNNITLSGFNTAIVNHGNSQLKNVIFKENQVNYNVAEDYGGAIRNWGILNCLECSFINNTAKYGGALYNDKGSQSTLRDCLFYINNGYGKTDSSFKTLDNSNIYTSKGANCMVMNHNDEVKVVNINSNSDFSNFISSIGNMKYVKVLILNFATQVTYNLENKISLPSVENLYVRGNGSTIYRTGNTPSDENSFLNVLQGQFILIDGLTIRGFNKAISNQGALSIFNSHFDGNKVNYVVKKDYGGAIYNDEGLLTISNTTFSNNYAKYGGAIYNYLGVISCTNCIFKSNEVYEDGGAIFNHYGIIAIYNSSFVSSVAKDDGGAIYNDFGKVIVDNSSFVNSKAEKGKDMFSYGKDAINVLTQSSIVIDSDAPSETVRWVARGIEILACFGMMIATTFMGIPSWLAGAICFVGGGLFAVGEEAFEECYLDHNFNAYNCMMMFAIAGILDFAAGAAASGLAKCLFKESTKEVVKETAEKTAENIVKDSGKELTEKTTKNLAEDSSKELTEKIVGKSSRTASSVFSGMENIDLISGTQKSLNVNVGKHGLKQTVKGGCLKLGKMAIMTMSIDAVAEILTEVLPRFDFCCEHKHPASTILDLPNVEMSHESDFNCTAV